MKRVLSGIQPTGRLHLGNLIGAIENWVKLQTQFDCYFFIADLHALTSTYNQTKNLKEDLSQVVIDLLASGLDPKKCVLFKQSDLAEHSELHLLLSMITPIPWLERVPSYKSKIAELKEIDLGTYGFLGYPVLQAADILLYQANLVPVGQDQLPHIELTREIGRRFNHLFGNVFPIPDDLLTKFPVLPGLDGRKMSKSYNNTIAISDPPEKIQKKVSAMITDPGRVKKTDKGNPKVCSVYNYFEIFDQTKTAEVASQCQNAERGCVACKKELAQVLIEYMAPIHAKRKELEKDKKLISQVLDDGKIKARAIAELTLHKAKQAMGLI